MIHPSEAGTPTPYEIVRPTPEDMPRLLELWREQYDFHYNLDPEHYAPYSEEVAVRELQESMQQTTSNILVAREGNTIVGFITFGEVTEDEPDTRIKHFGELKELLVTQEARRKGIGEALVTTVENQFSTQGLTYMRVQSSTFNKPAHALYEKLGYTPRQVIHEKPLGKTQTR